MVKIETLNNSKYNFNREAEVIHGNAATGEQYSLKRTIYSEVPLTPESAKHFLDEMDKEVEELRSQYPYQVISAVSYEEADGNQIIKLTPTTELILPDRIPIFDENDNEIIGDVNIRAEVKRRQAQWAEWERNGELEESVEIHHTDDGKTVRIKFRVAPIKGHPNETRFFNESSSKFTKTKSMQEIQSGSENNSNNNPNKEKERNNNEFLSDKNRERERERERAKPATKRPITASYHGFRAKS